jgi:ABC-type Fe3+-hydroxamate transport system substrate-binding protein
MKRLFAALLAVFLVLTLVGCGGQTASGSGYPLSVGGVEFSSSPRRVITMSRALTEDVAMLGFADRLVGVDENSDRPSAAVRQLDTVGSVLLPDVDAMLALSPDLVLTPETLPASATEALEAAGVSVLVVPYSNSLDGILSNLTALACVFAGSEYGASMGEQLTYFVDTALDYLADGVDAGDRAVFLMRLPQIAATEDTWLNDVLARLGLTNGAPGSDWVVSAEDGAFDADVLFVSDTITAEELAESVWGYTAAVQNERVVFLDTNLLEAQSPAAFWELLTAVQAAYPDGDFGELPDFSMELTAPEPSEPTLGDKIKGIFS